jgi:hypothetical protein
MHEPSGFAPMHEVTTVISALAVGRYAFLD